MSEETRRTPIPPAPQLANPTPQEEGVDLILPIAIIIAALIVSGSVIYGAKSIAGELKGSGKTVAAGAAADGGSGTGAAKPAQPTQVDTPPAPADKVDVGVGELALLGNPDAPVTVVEFSDLQCPFCKRAHDESFAQLKKEYVDTGKVKVAFRHFPLSFHQDAPKAGEAVECANDQGKTWEMIDAIFAAQQSMGVDAIKEHAKTLGMNTRTFNACLDGGEKKARVDADAADGAAVGVSGTPTFFINGNRLVGAQPFAQFKTVIDRELGA